MNVRELTSDKQPPVWLFVVIAVPCTIFVSLVVYLGKFVRSPDPKEKEKITNFKRSIWNAITFKWKLKSSKIENGVERFV